MRRKKTIGVLGVLAIVAVPFTWGAVRVSQARMPRSVTVVKAELFDTGGEFVILNRDNFAWKNVLVSLNNPATEDYVLKAPVIDGMTAYRTKFLRFDKAASEQFYRRTDGSQVAIVCETPSGPGRWVGNIH